MTQHAVVVKETLVLFRSRRARVMLFVYLGLLSCVVLWSWPTGEVLTLAAIASQRMLYVVGMGQLVLLLALIPGLTAGSIISERETGNLDLLQASRLWPVAILLGKWLGCVLYALVLLVASIPLVTLCFLLGTLDAVQLAQVYGHLLISVWWAGMVGLGISAMARTSYGALMTTYVLVIACCILPVVPSFLIGGLEAEIARHLSPIGSMISLLTPDVWLILQEPAGGPPAMQVYAAFCFAGAALAGLVAWRQLRRPYHPPVHRARRLIEDRRQILHRKLRFPFYLIDPHRRRRHIGSWINPVFARELRSRMLGQATTFLRVFFAVFVLSFVLTLVSIERTDAALVDSVRIIVVASQVVLIALLVPPLTAPAISRERELGTLDLLRLTYVGPWRLAAGKWYYALMVSACILIAALPMWVVIYLLQRVAPVSLGRAISVVVGALFGGTLAGLFASSLCRRTGAATGLAYLFTIGLLFGSLVPILLVPSLSTELRNTLFAVNPIVAAVRAVSLSLFRTLVEQSAWTLALGFLLGTAALFLVGVLLRTRYLYRLR